MAYRNGTYVAFAADGNTDVTTSDIRFYNIMKGWNSMKNKEFKLIDSHKKGSVLRKGSQYETIVSRLKERLRNSKRFMLLVGNTTRLDDDFVPIEISYAVDSCKLPVIVCYVNEREPITRVSEELYALLPYDLQDRIDNNKVKTIHIPFKEKIINHCILHYDYDNQPEYDVTVFKQSFYDSL